MAKLNDGPGAFTGTIGNLIYYRRSDMEGIFVRRKGGISKRKIKYDPRFERTRENNAEFAGRTRAASAIGDALMPIPRLADYNVHPVMTALMNKIQMESKNENRGERSILFSRHKAMLEGFQFNRKQPFTGVVRYPLQVTIDRKGTAKIQVPALMPDINLFLPWASPFYRLVFAFGAVTDFVYDHSNFITCEGATQSVYKTLPWQLASRTSAAQRITLRLKNVIDPSETLIVAAGIEMGTPTFDNKIDEVPRQGAAIILRVE